MKVKKRVTTIAAGAAGLTAVALGVVGAFPSGASVSPATTPSLPNPTSLLAVSPLPGAGSLPTLPGGSTSVPSGSQCESTPATPALPIPITTEGSGSVTNSQGGGSVTASSNSGLTVCTTGLPSLPGVPSLPGAPSLPSGGSVPAIPGLPSAGSLPGLPSASSVPAIPGLPSAGSVPAIPGLPSAGSLPALPSASSIPSLLGGSSFSLSGSGSSR